LLRDCAKADITQRPLGYDVQDRKLVVNDMEASTVLHIFRRYMALRSVRALKAKYLNDHFYQFH